MERSPFLKTTKEPGTLVLQDITNRSQTIPKKEFEAEKQQQKTYDSNNLKSDELQEGLTIPAKDSQSEVCKGPPEENLKLSQCAQNVSLTNSHNILEGHGNQAKSTSEVKKEEAKNEEFGNGEDVAEKFSFNDLFQEHYKKIIEAGDNQDLLVKGKGLSQESFAIVKLISDKSPNAKQNFPHSGPNVLKILEENGTPQCQSSKNKKELNSTINSAGVTVNNPPVLRFINQQGEAFKNTLEDSNKKKLQKELQKETFWLTYKKGGDLGQGNFGTVRWVSDLTMSQIYAIKELTKFNNETATQEYEALLRIKEKGNSTVLKVIDLKYVPDTCFFVVMEYGLGTLTKFLEHLKLKKCKWSDEDLLNLFFMLDDQAKELYEMGLCHHDIKPDNIIITIDHGQFKLTDFGLAELIMGEQVKIKGSPHYYHPELIKAIRKGRSQCNINPYEVDLFAIKTTINDIMANDGRKDDIDKLLQEHKGFTPQNKISLYDSLKDEYQALTLESLFENIGLDNRTIFYLKIGDMIKTKIPTNSSTDDKEKSFEKVVTCHLKSPEIIRMIYGDKHPLTATAYDNLGMTYYGLGQSEKARASHSKALEIRKEVFGDQHPDTAISYHHLGMAYYNLAKYEEALKFYSKALEIRKFVFGDQGRDTAASYNSLGVTYSALGKYKEAKPYQLKALEIFELTLGNQHQHVAYACNNLGILYYYLGKFEKSTKYHLKALKIWTLVFGDQHLNNVTSCNNLGLSYHALGQYEKAIEYSSKAVDITEKVVGVENYQTAMSYNTLGQPHYSLEHFDKARKYYWKSLDIKKLIYEDHSHPNLANSYSNLGLTYHKLGKFGEAKEFHQKALEIRKLAYKDQPRQHPEIANSLNNLALVYQSLEQYKEAIDFHMKALEIRKSAFGDKHPNTAASYNNLGLVYESMGQFQEAKEYYVKAFEIFKVAFRGNQHPHPNTAASYNNVGAAYGNLGDIDKAKEYHLTALQYFKSIFKDRHSYVAAVCDNLALSCKKLGQSAKATEYHSEAKERRNYLLFEKEQLDLPKSYKSLIVEYY